MKAPGRLSGFPSFYTSKKLAPWGIPDAPLPSAPRIEGPPPHLLLVRAPYYRAVIDGLTDGATRILREAGATFEQLDVAGAFELPQSIRIATRGSKRLDGFIALG